MKAKHISILIIGLALNFLTFAAAAIEPSGTYLYAEKDGQELFLDIYDPAEGSVTSIDGIAKPTIIFAFGGGFSSGERNEDMYKNWFKTMSDEGYRVVSIDYRLGMKGQSGLTISGIRHAIDIAVEDLFTATAFLIDNADSFGIDPSSIVISGSSAGAITALQTDWELANKYPRSTILPDGFKYAGVMSFSGAIISDQGKIVYNSTPAPTLFLHGTSDKIVIYKSIGALRFRFSGAGFLSKLFAKKKFNYSIYRFKDNGHEVALLMEYCHDFVIQFLENNVMKREKLIIDKTIDDPTIPTPDWARGKTTDLY